MNITGEIKILLIVMGCAYAMLLLPGFYLLFNPPKKLTASSVIILKMPPATKPIGIMPISWLAGSCLLLPIFPLYWL